MSDLPRLLDPDALDTRESPRARASIVVPTRWLREGARLEVDLPARLRCDLCDGGGCDACARSGGYRLEEARRPLEITLPRVTDDHFALRVTNPFGDAEPTLLVVRIAGAVEPSAGVRWVAPHHDVDRTLTPSAPPGSLSARFARLPALPKVPRWVGLAVVAVLAAVLAVVARWLVG